MSTASPARTSGHGATELPRAVIEFNRKAFAVASETTTAIARHSARSLGSVARTARDAGATVVGQARAAVTRVADSAAVGAAEVSGQVEAQGGAVAASATREATDLVERASEALDPSPGSGVPYEQWTRNELYERAQQLDIEGRARMNKAQLVGALRAR